MDFLIQRDELLRALNRAVAIVDKRPANAILACVLVQATTTGVRFVATDKTITFLGDFDANVRTPGEAAVDATNFFQTARVLPAGAVHVRLVDGQRIEVRAGTAYFKLNAFPGVDFPVTPPLDQSRSIRLATADLRRLIKQTLFSVAPDDNRYGLNGAHVEDVAGDKPMVRFVSTDGNRLSWSQAPYQGDLAVGRKMLLPRKALAEMAKLVEGRDDEVELAFGERAALATLPGVQLHMRLLEADFPDYRQVLPSSWKRRVVVEREAFVEALRCVSVFAADAAHSVKFAFNADGIVLTARKADAGDAREELAADLTGDAIVMGLNARFVQDVLDSLPDGRLTLELGETLSPCIVRAQEESNALFVIMPLRLD
jgi:DNA polymerase-3 subunit beta